MIDSRAAISLDRGEVAGALLADFRLGIPLERRQLQAKCWEASVGCGCGLNTLSHEHPHLWQEYGPLTGRIQCTGGETHRALEHTAAMGTDDAVRKLADQVQPGDVLIDGRRVVAKAVTSNSEMILLHFGGHPPARYAKHQTLYLRP
jgi:hypothetical protein